MSQSADCLRAIMRDADSASDRIGAFYELVAHPDLTWNDLLEGLDRDELIASHAVGTLYAALKGSDAGDSVPIRDRDEWERRIQARGLDFDAFVRNRPK